MHITSTILVAALASFAHAQQAATPKGFSPSVNTKLDVTFNSTSVKTPGELLSKASTSTAPSLALPASMANASASDTFMFVMLDLDVPPESGKTARRVLLHAMTTGFTASTQKASGSGMAISSKAKGPAMYLPPGPPATDTMAHRYVQLLFREPKALSVKASDFANTTARFNFDVEAFATENKLGAPVAGNFFMVDGRANSTAAEGGNSGGSGAARPTGGNGGGNGNGAARSSGAARATGSATRSAGAPRNTTAVFQGAVGRVEVGSGFVGLLSGLAMLVL